jgi:hypothetical protein
MGDQNFRDVHPMDRFFLGDRGVELERQRQVERRNAEAEAFNAVAFRTMPEDIRNRAKEWGLEAFVCGVWNNAFQCGYLQSRRDARAELGKEG